VEEANFKLQRAGRVCSAIAKVQRGTGGGCAVQPDKQPAKVPGGGVVAAHRGNSKGNSRCHSECLLAVREGEQAAGCREQGDYQLRRKTQKRNRCLTQTFKIEKFAFATVNSRVRELLIPLEPIVIQLKPSEDRKVFDFVVEVEERPDVDIVPFFSQKLNEDKADHPFLSLNGKIKKYEKKFNDHSEKLRRH
jgi:hypothetical protein